ncbi:aminomethyl-transferring glycine dehydrogenase subunit GcvPA [Thiorhodospira sibirica]|uniref:aminomethyl-transferring glycine dehydrogenase subunit GcvPA n=1 Tax=Thiorhodospira sibirica TaxID=154347 RepID=UPI000594ECDB|nr:aminomethyl-transferring glycine dehydrogenase subunit GcvPA [Thiorhodospira sibirica]
MPFIPHTAEDVRAMLDCIGVADIPDLFAEIPPELRTAEHALDALPPALNEMALSRLMQAYASRDQVALNFIGAGAYEHHIPAPVWELASRGEFYSAYTPYQAEASQGTLQLLYEYQSMMSALTHMEVSNASLYDGASALAEAILMAVRTQRKQAGRRVLLPATVHPAYREVVRTTVAAQGIALTELPYCPQQGHILPQSLEAYAADDLVALVIPQPNFFGVLEEVDALTHWAEQHGLLVIGVVNPLSLALLKPPGQWGTQGADIVVGDGQPLGAPLSSGGPYFGFMCTRRVHARQMPGRIVGRTVDADGKAGFVLTLQAREQHIRRSKATSNICTNQGLMVTAATIHLALLGAQGLADVARQCHANTHALADALQQTLGVQAVFSGAHFHEMALRLPVPVIPLLERMAAHGVLGGYALGQHDPQLADALLVCATETKTEADIARYVEVLGQCLAAASG